MSRYKPIDVLLRHDAKALLNGFRAGLSGHDILAIVVFVCLGLALAYRYISGLAVGIFPRSAVVAAAIWWWLAFSLHNMLLTRLAWFVSESPLAWLALTKRTAVTYVGSVHAALVFLIFIPATAVISYGLGSPILFPIFSIAAYFGGTLHASLRGSTDSLRRPAATKSPISSTGYGAVLELVRYAQLFGRGLTAGGGWFAPTTVFLGSLMVGLALNARAPDATAPAFVIMSLVIAIVTCRTEPGLVRFIPYAGYGAFAIAGAVSLLCLSMIAALGLAGVITATVHPSMLLLGIAVPPSIFIIYNLLVVWRLPGNDPRAVILQTQFELTILLLVALPLPPLVLAILVWRLWKAYRWNKTHTWQAA